MAQLPVSKLLLLSLALFLSLCWSAPLFAHPLPIPLCSSPGWPGLCPGLVLTCRCVVAMGSVVGSALVAVGALWLLAAVWFCHCATSCCQLLACVSSSWNGCPATHASAARPHTIIPTSQHEKPRHRLHQQLQEKPQRGRPFRWDLEALGSVTMMQSQPQSRLNNIRNSRPTRSSIAHPESPRHQQAIRGTA